MQPSSFCNAQIQEVKTRLEDGRGISTATLLMDSCLLCMTESGNDKIVHGLSTFTCFFVASGVLLSCVLLLVSFGPCFPVGCFVVTVTLTEVLILDGFLMVLVGDDLGGWPFGGLDSLVAWVDVLGLVLSVDFSPPLTLFLCPF